MEYEGKLYGKVAGKYVPMSMGTSDVDDLIFKVERLEQAARIIRSILNDCEQSPLRERVLGVLDATERAINQ